MRVKYAHIVRGDAHIELDRWAQGHSALRGQRTTAHVAFELRDVDAVFGELQRSVAVLQANRQIGRGQCRIDDLDSSCEAWTVSSAIRVDIELELSGGP